MSFVEDDSPTRSINYEERIGAFFSKRLVEIRDFTGENSHFRIKKGDGTRIMTDVNFVFRKRTVIAEKMLLHSLV